MSQLRRNKRGHDPYMDEWHRKDSLKRYVGPHRAQWMSQVDVDSCEYCHLCSEPIALVETKDVSAITKNGTVTAKLATRADLDAYLVEYKLSVPRGECPACCRAEPVHGADIERFFITEWTGLHPKRFERSPKEYAEWLWSLRFRHWESECKNPQRHRMAEWDAEHT